MSFGERNELAIYFPGGRRPTAVISSGSAAPSSELPENKLAYHQMVVKMENILCMIDKVNKR